MLVQEVVLSKNTWQQSANRMLKGFKSQIREFGGGGMSSGEKKFKSQIWILL